MTFPFKSMMTSKTMTTTTDEQYYADDDSKVVSIESDSSSKTTTVTTAAAVVPVMTTQSQQDGRCRNNKKTRIMIDETKLSKEDAERLMMKRAYNRECAERARKRIKATIVVLQQQVTTLHTEKNELRQDMKRMEQELQHLKEKNQSLLYSKLISEVHLDIGHTPSLFNDLYYCERISALSNNTSPIPQSIIIGSDKMSRNTTTDHLFLLQKK